MADCNVSFSATSCNAFYNGTWITLLYKSLATCIQTWRYSCRDCSEASNLVSQSLAVTMASFSMPSLSTPSPFFLITEGYASTAHMPHYCWQQNLPALLLSFPFALSFSLPLPLLFNFLYFLRHPASLGSNVRLLGQPDCHVILLFIYLSLVAKATGLSRDCFVLVTCFVIRQVRMIDGYTRLVPKRVFVFSVSS